MKTVDVGIIGGGITGLSAAYELSLQGIAFQLFEAESRIGGLILTENVDGFTLDAGPDSLLVQKPAAIELCDELGIGHRLIPTLPPHTAYILRAGTLYPLPQTSVLGVPTKLFPFAMTGLFSTLAKIRMAMDLVLPVRTSINTEDESIESFFRERFGDEAVEYLAEPLLAGIHAGDVTRLSMRALFPHLLEAERQSGSLIRAFRKLNKVTRDISPFRSLPEGIAELVEALAKALPEDSISRDTRVEAIRGKSPYMIATKSGNVLRCRSLILAVPAHITADLIAPIDEELALLCRTINYASTATVLLSYVRSNIRHALHGTGFLVPRSESGYTITAGSWVSMKWPNRAPEGHVLLRAFLGGARDPHVLDRTDGDLIRQAHHDLSEILKIESPPELKRVYRWHRASPQYEVGHPKLVANIERKVKEWPGLFLTGNGFRGVGIPACIADARSTARAAAEPLLKRQS